MPNLAPLSPSLLHQLEQLSLVSRRRLASQGQGDRRSRLRGNSLELADYRAYTPGDDLRRIDWNVYARSEDLFVRLYEDEQILSVHLLIDVSRSMDWGTPNKLEAALRLAQALSYAGLSGYDQISFGFIADQIVRQVGPFWGQPQRGRALAALASAPIGGQTDFGASLGRYVDRVRRPSLLILISDLLSPGAEQGLRRLANPRHESIVLHLLAPQELEPEPAEDVQLVDRETGETIEVSLDLATLAGYRQRLAEWTDGLARLGRERGARYVQLSSADDLEHGGLAALQRAGVLR